MEDFKKLDKHSLLDLLAELTTNYTKKFAEGESDSPELRYLKETIIALQDELRVRQEESDQNVSLPRSASTEADPTQ